MVVRHERHASRTPAVSKSPTDSTQSRSLSTVEAVTAYGHVSVALYHTPFSEMDMLGSLFARNIGDRSVGTGFHVGSIYGGFLYEVPRYLGHSPALDAAAEALIASHTHFCSKGNEAFSKTLLLKYNKAVQALVPQLSAEDTAGDSKTLCAIMMLIIVEVSGS